MGFFAFWTEHTNKRSFYHHHIIIDGKSNGIYMNLITLATQSCLVLIYRSKLNINYKYTCTWLHLLYVYRQQNAKRCDEKKKKNSTDNNLISKRVERCIQIVWLRNEMSFSKTAKRKTKSEMFCFFQFRFKWKNSLHFSSGSNELRNNN